MGEAQSRKTGDTLGERCPFLDQVALTPISQHRMKGYKTNATPRPDENIHPDVSGRPACL